jgi:hypothetical protein
MVYAFRHNKRIREFLKNSWHLFILVYYKVTKGKGIKKLW